MGSTKSLDLNIETERTHMCTPESTIRVYFETVFFSLFLNSCVVWFIKGWWMAVYISADGDHDITVTNNSGVYNEWNCMSSLYMSWYGNRICWRMMDKRSGRRLWMDCLFVSFFVTCENWCRYVVRMQYVRTSYVDYDNEMKWDVFVTNSYYRELKNGQ